MSGANVLGSVMWEVLNERRERTLGQEETNTFYATFQDDVSGKIDKIRSEQRKAIPDCRVEGDRRKA